MDSHLLPTHFQRPDQVREPLHVILPVSNSPRFRSRWRLLQDTVTMVEQAHAIPYIVEVAFGDREFAVTERGNPRHIQLRTPYELWYKENAVNAAVPHLPPDAKYLAYLDTDTRFARDDWANETIQKLQHYAAVQMWSEYHLLDEHYQIIGSMHSFMSSYLRRDHSHFLKTWRPKQDPYSEDQWKRAWPGPPGLAWAWRRDAWNLVGGLLDVCVCGSGDVYMANALLGRLDDGLVDPRFSAGYRRAIFDWQDRAKALHKDIGVVPGAALHYFHGAMKSRGYSTRNAPLIKYQYNPDTDLMRDAQGLHQLRVRDERTIAIRDSIREYLHSRREDAAS